MAPKWSVLGGALVSMDDFVEQYRGNAAHASRVSSTSTSWQILLTPAPSVVMATCAVNIASDVREEIWNCKHEDTDLVDALLTSSRRWRYAGLELFALLLTP
eukprot:608595-Rhodomonas_salina.1